MTQPEYLIIWPELLKGSLIRRYKRFIADVQLVDGNVVTVHCPNSGAMTTCAEPGRDVYLSRQNQPHRKLKFTWELIRMPDSIVGVNTQIPNRLVEQAILNNRVTKLTGYQTIKREKSLPDRSRIDLFLSNHMDHKTADCYVEIKNCTLVTRQTAYFPDAQTKRGLKHLVALQELVRRGYRAAMFYLIQRMDAEHFAPAHHIDPEYGRELINAQKNGVEIYAYDVWIDLTGICLRNTLPVRL